MLSLAPRLGAHSVSLILVHVVWATRRRLPLLDAALDESLLRLLHAKAAQLGARLIAGGAAEDHVHILVQLPADVSVAMLAGRLKGASSHAFGRRVTWQAGYWVESVSPDCVQDIARYVGEQRAHHAAVRSAEGWELDPTRA